MKIHQMDAGHRAGAGRQAAAGDGRQMARVLAPLAVDVALPLGVYYLAHKGLGMDLVASLALSSVVPAVRTVAGAVRDRSVNGLAALMLAVNAAGIALSFLTGDPRLMIAKDSGISSVIGLVILVSAFGSRPLMSAGLKPFLTKGDAAREAAWDRLSSGASRFRALERRFTMVWGLALLAECAARIAGAYTVPVETMAWLGTVMLVGAIGLGAVVSGSATEPMKELLDAEVRAQNARETAAPAAAAA
ncbi:VC0807 family protein [Actinomadura verrucosospora]|uniref:AlbD n=1 Tax=Actinomadura verrucosospora TaxID=46165 RepID=A0A7D4A9F4_ACTVE|nr:VC0807 family protein [Actinomadura verrucosospora]QKG24727.1 AlbD [Actinomadura verrucosospora]